MILFRAAAPIRVTPFPRGLIFRRAAKAHEVTGRLIDKAFMIMSSFAGLGEWHDFLFMLTLRAVLP